MADSHSRRMLSPPYLHHLLQSLHQVLRLASKPTPNAATMEEETQMGAVEVRLPDQKQSGRNLSQKTPSNDRRPPQTDDRRRLHQDARVPYDYGGGKKSGYAGFFRFTFFEIVVT